MHTHNHYQLQNDKVDNVIIPQGDAASALFFIIYLAVTLKNVTNKSIENDTRLPNHLSDHGYEQTENLVFTLDQQYADDISPLNFLGFLDLK